MRSSRRDLASTTAQTLRTYAKSLPHVAAFLFALGLVLVAVMVAVILAARPAVTELISAIDGGAQVPDIGLLTANGWGAVMGVVMLATALAFVAGVTLIADAALTGKRLHGKIRALTGSLVPLAGVAATWILAVLLAVATAPLLTVAVLAYCAYTRWWSTSRPTVPLWWAIPGAIAVLVAVRTSLSGTSAVVSGGGIRASFISSWRRTHGHAWLTAAVMGVSLLASLGGAWLLLNWGASLGQRGASFALEIMAALIFSPIPLVAAAVLHRRLGGTSHPRRVTSIPEPHVLGRMRSRPATASAVATAFVVTLLVPLQNSAAGASGLEAPAVTLTGASPGRWNWGFGDTSAITGNVTGAQATPSGSVGLLSQDDDAPAVMVQEVPLDADGRFTFDRMLVKPGTDRIWVVYSGDAVYADSASPLQSVMVGLKWIPLQHHVSDPPAHLTVGDVITLVAEVDTSAAFPHQPVTGEVEFFVGNNMDISVGFAPLVDGRAEKTTVVTERRFYFGAALRDPWYGAGAADLPPLTSIDPASTTTTVDVPLTMAWGAKADAIATVTAPQGVPVNGTVEFTWSNPLDGTHGSMGSAPVIQGSARIPFCAGGTSCTGTVLPFADESADDLLVTASFTPHNQDDETRILLPSISESQRVMMWIGSTGGSCVVVDVVYSGLGLTDDVVAGNPRVLTPSNCVDYDAGVPQGHSRGDWVSLTAASIPGFEVKTWWSENPGGTTIWGSGENVTWQVPEDPAVAPRITVEYQPICFSYGASVTGNGGLFQSSALSNPYTEDGDGNCQLPQGGWGARHGSVVQFDMRANHNSSTGEDDAFYRVVNPPVPVTVAGQNYSILGTSHLLRFTITRDVIIPVLYGPVCRTVETPAQEWGGAELLTASNCQSPQGSGFTVGSWIEVVQAVDHPDASFFGWSINGVEDPSLEGQSPARVQVSRAAITRIEPTVQVCHALTTSIMEGPNVYFFVAPSTAVPSSVTINTPFNCPDGSQRFIEGTTVVLTPVPGTDGTLPYSFGGWKDADDPGQYYTVPATNSGSHQRTVTVTGPFSTTATFYKAAQCSTITVIPGPLTIADLEIYGSGSMNCGPGRYHDEAKSRLYNWRETTTKQFIDNERGIFHPSAFFVITPSADRFTNIRATGRLTWRSGSVRDTTYVTCDPANKYCDMISMSGDVELSIQQCQALKPDITIRITGDTSGRLYTPSDFGVEDFQWMESRTSMTCGFYGQGNPNQWVARDGEVTFWTSPPAVGFNFLNWGKVDNYMGTEWYVGAGDNKKRLRLGVVAETSTDVGVLSAQANYEAKCAHVSLSEGITILEPKPTCPDGRYLVGTFLQVVADHTADGDRFDGWRRGTLQGTEGTHTDGRPSALTLVTKDMNIAAYYPNSNTRFWSAVAQSGKIVLGVATVAAIAAIPIACPPCGVALTALAVATIFANMIPGVSSIGGGILKSLNPLNLLECTASWGFGATDRYEGPTEDDIYEESMDVAKLGITTVRFLDTAREAGAAQAGQQLLKGGVLTKVGSGVSVVYSLYDNKVHEIDMSEYQSRTDLRDTAGWNNCLRSKYGH